MAIIKHYGELTPDELYDLLRARQEVFFLEQKVDCEDLDGVDSVCTHMWEEAGGQITGYLRMIPAGVTYPQASISRVLVRKPYRFGGISRRMMGEAIKYMVEEWGVKEIMIGAQAYLCDYYSEFGFRIASGEYDDGGIPHYKMLLTL